jgi:hypothetical protein
MEPTGNDRPRLIVENFNRVLSITPDWETLLLGKYSFNMGCVLLTARVETGETDCLVESETFYEISGSLTSPRWTLFEVVPNTQASEHPPRYMMVAERDGSGLRQLFDISRREDSAVHLSIMPDDEWVMYSELYYLAGEGYQGYQRRVRISDGTEALLPRGFHVSVSPPIGAGPVD